MMRSQRVEYNTQRPHSALGYRPPAPVVAFRPAAGSVSQPGVVMSTLTLLGTKGRSGHFPTTRRENQILSRYCLMGFLHRR